MDNGRQTTISCFDPIVDKNTKIIILGTLPGPESLATNQYYASPNNCFWRIIFDIFNQLPIVDYNSKCGFLLEHKMGIWDVMGSANREGYADSNIQNFIPNDFGTFIKKHSQLRGFIFNGGKAEDAFRNAFPSLYTTTKHELVLSSSGALAKKYIEKRDNWKLAIEKFIKHFDQY